MVVCLFVVIQIYNKFSGFLLFLQLSTIYHSKCRMNPNNTTQKFHNHPYSDFRNTNRTTIIIKKELMMFFKNYGIKGISLLRGGLGEDIKKGRRKAGCMSLFEEACFPSSFCFYSFFWRDLFFDLVEEYLFCFAFWGLLQKGDEHSCCYCRTYDS